METHVQCKNRLLSRVRHSILTSLSEGTEVYFGTFNGCQYIARYDGLFWHLQSDRDTYKVVAKRRPLSPFSFYRILQEPCVRDIVIYSPGLMIDINPEVG